MSVRIWVETGGDTGGAEVWASEPDVKIARLDWDDYQDRNIEPDDVFYWLETFGDIMPKATRSQLLTTLQPDDDFYQTSL